MHRFCPLELYNMLQRSLWVKPCVKEVCGPTKTLTTHVIPMKTVALATEEEREKKGFSVYPVENPSPLDADIPHVAAHPAQGCETLALTPSCALQPHIQLQNYHPYLLPAMASLLSAPAHDMTVQRPRTSHLPPTTT